MNAKHLKKFTEIEDFATILPTSADSNTNPIDQKIEIPKALETLAIMDDPSKQTLAIDYSQQQSAPLIATLESNID